MKEVLVLTLVAVVAIIGMMGTPTGMAANCSTISSDIVVCKNSMVSGPSFIGGNLVGQQWKEKTGVLETSSGIYGEGLQIKQERQRLFDSDKYVERKQITVRNSDGTYRNV